MRSRRRADQPGLLRRNGIVLVAVVFVALPALVDIPSPLTRYLDEHLPHTLDAATALLSIFVIARVIESWNTERDRRRFAKISEITFRGLSQQVNDVERMLLAPLTGIGLAASGIPGFTEEDHRRDLERLERAGIAATPTPPSGFWWGHLDPATLRRTAGALARQPGFAQAQFLVISAARRRIQDSISDIAAVAVTLPDASVELDRLGTMADQLVSCLEAWRRAARSEDDAVVDAACDELIATLTTTDRALTALQDRVRLPAGRPDASIAATTVR